MDKAGKYIRAAGYHLLSLHLALGWVQLSQTRQLEPEPLGSKPDPDGISVTKEHQPGV